MQRNAVAQINRQHLQLVGIGVAIRAQHPRNAETGQLFRRIVDAFNLKSDGVERKSDFRHRSLGFKEIAEP